MKPQLHKTFKAVNRILDTVWTVEYKHDSPNTVDIIKYTPFDTEGYEKENELPKCRPVEDGKRHFIALEMLSGGFDTKVVKTYPVTNQKKIFSYTS